MTRDLPPRSLRPPHPVQDCAKVELLAASMREHGWQSRPLLVVDESAITGTHRLAAAIAAGLETVPCYVLSSGVVGEISEDEAERWWQLANDAGDDDSRLELLDEIGDAEAIALMREEIDAAEAAGA